MNTLLLRLGMGGAVLAVLCCVTPLLPWLFGAIGLSGYLGYVYRDDVLLPLAAFFLILAGVALWRRHRTKSN